MELYHFVTQWSFPVPLERVWEELVNPSAWTQWLTDFRQVRLRHPGQANGLGSVSEIVYRGLLPYGFRFTLEVVEVDPPYLLSLKASGDLEGTGRWILSSGEGGTHVTYRWDVGVTLPGFRVWVNVPGIKALTRLNHEVTMARAERALRQRLDSTQNRVA